MLCELLYGYAHTMRLYHGDWSADALHAASVLLTVSSVLAADSRYESAASALHAAMAAAQAPGARLTALPSLRASLATLNDTAALVTHGHYALDAIADAKALVDAAIDDATRAVGAEVPGGTGLHAGRLRSDAQTLRTLKAASRKLLFYAAWVQETLIVHDTGADPRYGRVLDPGRDPAVVLASLRGDVMAVLQDQLVALGEAPHTNQPSRVPGQIIHE
jgi:hypothetical protein